MFIKNLELTNFQKHTHLVLNFTKNVNVIHGETDTGKSCVIRALKWIFFGEPRGDVIRKENSKKTSVKVILDNNVEIERIKSTTVNAYIIKKDGEEKRFDAVGKSIPEEVQKALQVNTIDIDNENVILNIADQISLPFLLDKPATSRMKLFNKLTGNDIVDKLLQSFNKDLLRISREEKSEIEKQKDLEAKHTECKDNQQHARQIYNKFSIDFTKIDKLNSKYEKLEKFAERLKEINERLEQLNASKKEAITDINIDDLKLKAEKLEKLQQLLYNFKSVKNEIVDIKNNLIKVKEIDISNLKEILEKLNKYRKFIIELKRIEEAGLQFNSKITQLSKDIKIFANKYKEALKKCKICPTCKTKITDEKIKGIEL